MLLSVTSEATLHHPVERSKNIRTSPVFFGILAVKVTCPPPARASDPVKFTDCTSIICLFPILFPSDVISVFKTYKIVHRNVDHQLNSNHWYL